MPYGLPLMYSTPAHHTAGTGRLKHLLAHCSEHVGGIISTYVACWYTVLDKTTQRNTGDFPCFEHTLRAAGGRIHTHPPYVGKQNVLAGCPGAICSRVGTDLDAAGIRVIHIDEPAFRAGLPLLRSVAASDSREVISALGIDSGLVGVNQKSSSRRAHREI